MRVLLVTIVVAAAALAGACGGSGGPASPSQVASLTGTWRATKAEYVSIANPGTKVDVVSHGTIVTLVLDTGTFTLTIADPGLPGNVTKGTWTSSSDVLKLSPAGMSWGWEFDMTLSGNTLTLNGANVDFDFQDDGRMEEAKLYLSLIKQ